METYKTYLEQLDVYPTSDQISEASDLAQNKTTEYVLGIDDGAIVTVEEGIVYIKWSDSKIDEDGEWQIIAQLVFDEQFGDKIDELQNDYSRIDTNSFIDVECDDMKDFQENADFGQKWKDEDGVYHYKIKEPLFGEPESFYYENGEIKID